MSVFKNLLRSSQKSHLKLESTKNKKSVIFGFFGGNKIFFEDVAVFRDGFDQRNLFKRTFLIERWIISLRENFIQGFEIEASMS